ncbi:MAG: DUF1330 domain-containing protein [Pontibacterium sp.]
MTSYVIVESNVLDSEKLMQYSKRAAPTVKQFGGKFIAKGAKHALHGESRFANQSVIQFPSEEDAKAWYASDDYQALAGLRDQAMESHFQLVAGL